MERRNERRNSRLNRCRENLFAREMGKAGYFERTERGADQRLQLNMLLNRLDDGTMAVVHPHADGGGLGYIRIVLIMRQPEAVTPDAYYQNECQNWQDIRPEELRDGHARIRQFRMNRPGTPVCCVRDNRNGGRHVQRIWLLVQPGVLRV